MSGGRGDVAAAALALVGVPFRPGGRDPAGGLDCVGLVACALRAAGWRGAIPEGYGWRMRGAERWRGWAEAQGFAAVADGGGRGDVAVYRVGPEQLHLAIALGAGAIVHAHAGLRRVVTSPVPGEWRIFGAWRPDGGNRAGGD